MEKGISFFKKPYAPYLLLGLIIVGVYYKFFLLGKIPFPGDLLIGSYFPWLDYFKMPVQNPLISDVFSQFFLWKYLAIDSFKNLQWPLWNPNSFSGTPLLATYHSATLYPLNILIFLPKYFGWGLFIFSQSLFAALNFYLFSSTFTKSIVARFSGAIIFTFGGLMTTWLELGTAVHALAWLPLSLYSIQKYAEDSKVRYLILLTISQVLTILAGNVQIAVYSFIIILAFNLLKGFRLSVVLAIFFPIAACAIQLLPTLDLFQKSIRLTESYIQESNFGLLQGKDFLKFVIADYFGNPVTRNYWGFLNYSETSLFVGTLTLPLIIFAYKFLNRSRIINFFLILLPISLILSFDNPLSQVLYQIKLPLLTSSYASRLFFITNFAISVLIAFSLDQIQKANQQFNKFLKTIIWSWAAILGMLLGTILSREIIQEILRIPPQKEYLEFYLRDRDFSLINFNVALRNSFLPLALTTLFLALAIFIKLVKEKVRPKLNINLFFIIFFIGLTFDLGRYFLKFNPFITQNLIFPSTPAIEFLKNQKEPFRLGREHAEVLPPNTWTAYNLQSLEGYDPLYLNRYGKFMHYLNGGDIRFGNSTRYAELSSKYDSPFIDAANVKYFIGIGRDKNGYAPGDLINYHFNEAGYIRVFNDKSAVILENLQALPRAYFAPSFKIADEPRLENIIMTDLSFDPRITALLEKDLKIATTSGKGQASILRYSPNIVKLETKTENPEILILADQYDGGWKAKIDGEQVPISPANYIFRAVKVPAGEHEVLFSYYPKSFELGIKISAISFLILLAVALVSIRKKTF